MNIRRLIYAYSYKISFDTSPDIMNSLLCPPTSVVTRVRGSYKNRKLPVICGDYYASSYKNDHKIFSPDPGSFKDLLEWCADNSDITKELFDKYGLEYVDKDFDWDILSFIGRLDPNYGFILEELLRTSELEVLEVI